MLVENLRKLSIQKLFSVPTFSEHWPKWQNEIKILIKKNYSAEDILNIADSLRSIVMSTSVKGRGQSELSGVGAAWECLVTWYLNLCLVNTRAVVFKFYKNIIPTPIKEALTINFSGENYLSESDLIGFVLPNKPEYLEKKTSDFSSVISLFEEFSSKNFKDFEVSVIQCKTNWNDSAQIPFLWNLLYKLGGVSQENVRIGINNRATNALKRFDYSFVTMPSNKNLDSYKSGGLQVERVKNLSGGNYWGTKTKNGVASSLKEMIGKSFISAFDKKDIRDNINSFLKDKEQINYFKI
jgi:hypothetical protein